MFGKKKELKYEFDEAKTNALHEQALNELIGWGEKSAHKTAHGYLAGYGDIVKEGKQIILANGIFNVVNPDKREILFRYDLKGGR